jgi:adenylate cyclase class 2
MLEIEAKFAVEDFAPVERQLAAWGAATPVAREDTDLYFNAPDRDFKATDEALRLRRIGPANFVTYKGPKRDTTTKTREEIEVPLAAGDAAAADFARLLTRLGYREVAVVRKRRRVAPFRREGFDVQASLDELDGVGRFVELEIVADEPAFEAARAVLLAAAAGLGLQRQERRSYLELLLTARAEGRT